MGQKWLQNGSSIYCISSGRFLKQKEIGKIELILSKKAHNSTLLEIPSSLPHDENPLFASKTCQGRYIIYYYGPKIGFHIGQNKHSKNWRN